MNHLRIPHSARYILSLTISLLSLITSDLRAIDFIQEPTRVHDKDFASVDDEIEAIHFNFPFQLGEKPSGKVKSTLDLTALVAQSYRDFADGTGRFQKWHSIPANQKVLTICRYNLGDKRILEAILYAKKKGIRIQIISDGNIYFQEKKDFAADQKYSSDFENAAYNDTVSAEVLQELLRNGFTLNADSAASIHLAPLQNLALLKIGDIYHHKHDIFSVCTDASCKVTADALWQESSHNAVADKKGNPNPRVNMHIEHKSHIGAVYALDQAHAMAKVFNEGKPINAAGEIEALQKPLELFYTGSPSKANATDTGSQSIAFTNGAFNPNYRIAKMIFESVGLDPNGEKLTAPPADSVQRSLGKIWFLHFAPTYSRGFSAFKALRAGNPKSQIWTFCDGNFIDPMGFGLLPTMFGWMRLPPFGPPITFPFSRSLLNLPDGSPAITGYILQAPNPNEPDREPEGAPLGKTVMHLKLTIARVLENGVPWIYVYSGSLNFSNHEENAELQIHYRFPESSPIAQELISAVEQLPHVFKEYSIEPDIAILRKVLERLLGQSIFDFEPKWVHEQIELARKQDFEQLKQNILQQAKRQTQVAKPLPYETIQERIEKVVGFRKWYMAQPYKYEPVFPERLGLFVELILIMERKPFPANQVKEVLKSLVWSSDATPTEIERRAQEAWQALKITEAFPVTKPRKKPVALVEKTEPPSEEGEPTQKEGASAKKSDNAPPTLAERRTQAAEYLESLDAHGVHIPRLACGDQIAALGL